MQARFKWIALGLVALFLCLILLMVSWRGSEPSYEGKTVTEWIDTLPIRAAQTNDAGVSVHLFGAERIVHQPGFKAVMAVGDRAIPVLMERIMEPPLPEDPRLLTRWRNYWREKWQQIRFGRAPRKSITYPLWQRERKDTAGILLIALGTNRGGGFERYMETYARAPRPRVTGPQVGVFPVDTAKVGAGISPERRVEVLGAISTGMRHTNAEVRHASANAARGFPEEFAQWKPAFLELLKDSDSHACFEALAALMTMLDDVEVRLAVRRFAEDEKTSERNRQFARTILGNWEKTKNR